MAVGPLDGETDGLELGAGEKVGDMVIVGRGLVVGAGDGAKDIEGDDVGSRDNGTTVGAAGAVGLKVGADVVFTGGINESMTSATSSSSWVTPGGSNTSIVWSSSSSSLGDGSV